MAVPSKVKFPPFDHINQGGQSPVSTGSGWAVANADILGNDSDPYAILAGTGGNAGNVRRLVVRGRAKYIEVALAFNGDGDTVQSPSEGPTVAAFGLAHCTNEELAKNTPKDLDVTRWPQLPYHGGASTQSNQPRVTSAFALRTSGFNRNNGDYTAVLGFNSAPLVSVLKLDDGSTAATWNIGPSVVFELRGAEEVIILNTAPGTIDSSGRACVIARVFS